MIGGPSATPLYVPAQSAAAPSFTVRAEIPSPADDAAAGFSAGSQLYSTAARATYLCVDATNDAANWQRTNRHYRRNLWHTSPQRDNEVYLEPGGPFAPAQPWEFAAAMTITTPAPALGASYRESLGRTRYESGAIDNVAFVQSVVGLSSFVRGDATDRGGLVCQFVFAPNPTDLATQVSFFGFAVDEILPGQDMDALANVFGLGKRQGDTDLHLVHNDAAGATVWTSLGADFPADDADAVYRATLYWAPNAATLYWLIERLDSTAFFASGNVAADIPSSTTFLRWMANAWDGPQAELASFEIVYMETEAL